MLSGRSVPFIISSIILILRYLKGCSCYTVRHSKLYLPKRISGTSEAPRAVIDLRRSDVLVKAPEAMNMYHALVRELVDWGEVAPPFLFSISVC